MHAASRTHRGWKEHAKGCDLRLPAGGAEAQGGGRGPGSGRGPSVPMSRSQPRTVVLPWFSSDSLLYELLEPAAPTKLVLSSWHRNIPLLTQTSLCPDTLVTCFETNMCISIEMQKCYLGCGQHLPHGGT